VVIEGLGLKTTDFRLQPSCAYLFKICEIPDLELSNSTPFRTTLFLVKVEVIIKISFGTVFFLNENKALVISTPAITSKIDFIGFIVGITILIKS